MSRFRLRPVAWTLTLLLMASTASAEYIRSEIEKVPVARLVENLEAHLQKNPKDTQTRFNLAHLHAMAYSLKADTTECTDRAYFTKIRNWVACPRNSVKAGPIL